MYCPVCDRKYDSGTNQADTLEIVKNHVAEDHPDYDADWDDTSP